MRFLSRWYDKVLVWSRHRHAPIYLSLISFAEASFFPIPPDVMLVPMALAEPRRAWRFATLATMFSTLGGVLGYVIGLLFLALIYPVLVHVGYVDAFHQAQQWFRHYGAWVVFLAAFTPIPFKLITIAAGSLSMPLIPFIIAAFIGRGMRFYLEAGLLRWGGAHVDRIIRKTIDWLGWILIALVGIGYVVYCCW